MKLYLQILIIGLLIFSSKQYTCSIYGYGVKNGFYNAPIGAGGICTNKGVCQRSFSETPNSPASRHTLTGDCFHCEYNKLFLDRGYSVSNVRCFKYCENGYTDSPTGGAASYPLKERYGTCKCPEQGQHLIDINSGRCGTQCEPGYVQSKDGIPISVQYTHCLYCHSGLVNNNGVCECPIKGEYLSKVQGFICGPNCVSNSTHNSDGSPPDIPSTGHCLTCLSTHTFYQGICTQKCPSGQYFTSIYPNCGTSCKSGYTDQKYLTLPQDPITGNCKYCLFGLTKFHYTGCRCFIQNWQLTSTTSKRCGRTCEQGYTYNPDGSAPNTPIPDHCLFCVSATHQMVKGVCQQK